MFTVEHCKLNEDMRLNQIETGRERESSNREKNSRITNDINNSVLHDLFPGIRYTN